MHCIVFSHLLISRSFVVGEWHIFLLLAIEWVRLGFYYRYAFLFFFLWKSGEMRRSRWLLCESGSIIVIESSMTTTHYHHEKKMRKASWNRLNCESLHNYCMCLFVALWHAFSLSRSYVLLSLTFPLSHCCCSLYTAAAAYATNDEEWRCCVKYKSHEKDERKRTGRRCVVESAG